MVEADRRDAQWLEDDLPAGGSREDSRRPLSPGAPVALFPTRLATGGNTGIGGFGSHAEYAVAPDGRFVLNVSAENAAASPITIGAGGRGSVLELAERLPTKAKCYENATAWRFPRRSEVL